MLRFSLFVRLNGKIVRMNQDMPNELWQAYERLAAHERRLGIFIPPIMVDLLSIEDTSWPERVATPFEDRCSLWLNAAPDGFPDFDDWKIASEDNWFESITNIPGLDHLVIFAAMSGDELCLDYRENGLASMPKVVHIDTCAYPATICVVADSAEEFALAVLECAKKAEEE